MNIHEYQAKELLSKYGAHKVFVEGDAIILAILERQGDPALSVARACVLAREMVEIVGGYNHLLQRAGLQAVVAIFELQVGDERDEIHIAAAFADTVDRPLRVLGAGADRRQRIGDGNRGIEPAGGT